MLKRDYVTIPHRTHFRSFFSDHAQYHDSDLSGSENDTDDASSLKSILYEDDYAFEDADKDISPEKLTIDRSGKLTVIPSTVSKMISSLKEQIKQSLAEKTVRLQMTTMQTLTPSWMSTRMHLWIKSIHFNARRRRKCRRTRETGADDSSNKSGCAKQGSERCYGSENNYGASVNFSLKNER